MFRILAIVCLVAGPVFGTMEKGFKRTWGLNPFFLGSHSFVDLPETVSAAIAQNWENVTAEAPTSHPGYEDIQLWCPLNERVVCIIYDSCGKLVGKQIGIDEAKITGRIYDWKENGFTSWTPTIDGETKQFQTARQYYVSKEWLQRSCEVRNRNRNDNKIIQDNLYLTNFNGSLLEVGSTVEAVDLKQEFTAQACIPTMGKHYYYKATPSLTCTAQTIAHWFLLTNGDEIIGTGFMLPGKYNKGSERQYFEEPNYLAIKLIVPTGPQCLWDYGSDPGEVTMHTYFTAHWWALTCL